MMPHVIQQAGRNTKVKNVSCGKAVLRSGTVIAAVMALTGCALAPEPLSQMELEKRVAASRAVIARDQAPVTAPITLPEAIARAAKYNLDHRLKLMEEAQALDQLDAAKFDLLPKLTANAGYSGRDNHNSSTSRGLYSNRQTEAEPTYSSDREHFTGDLTMTWNALDFGVSYYAARQAGDRSLIAEERRRKVLHNLVQEVRAAYWRAASSQKLRDDVVKTLTVAEQALNDSRKVEQANIRNPIDTLRFQRSLLEAIRQLETIDQELSTARTELSVLIGLPPGTTFEVAVPEETDMVPPAWNTPIERMEELALVNNPDLREQDYQSRISVAETRKAILRMLPGLSFSVGRNYDSNSMLIANRWTEAGAKVTWNLLNVFSGPAELRAAERGEEVAQQRSLAMHMAVLAQLHIARRQFDIACTQFERASQLYDVDRRILRLSEVREANDAQGALERVANNTSMIVGLLRRYQALAQVHAAFGRMQAAMGADAVPGLTDAELPVMTRNVAAALEQMARGQAAAEPEAAAPAAEATTPAAQLSSQDASLLAALGNWFASLGSDETAER